MLTVMKKKNHPKPPPNRKQMTANGGEMPERKDIKFERFRWLVKQRKEDALTSLLFGIVCSKSPPKAQSSSRLKINNLRDETRDEAYRASKARLGDQELL